MKIQELLCDLGETRPRRMALKVRLRKELNPLYCVWFGMREENTMRSNKGFSLIELLIVVAIVLVIAAIAIPNLLRARIAANESSAAGSIRNIITQEITFSTTYPTVGYAATLVALGPAN